MYPSIIAKTIPLQDGLIDIFSLANSTKISFIKSEITDIDFIKKRICLENRPFIEYSRIILNCGSKTKVSAEFQDLIESEVAFPVKPFFESYQFIKSQDKFNKKESLPFVIIGSGLAAIEIAFSLRKRWSNRKIIIVCELEKIPNKFVIWLNNFDIHLKPKLNFEYHRILLCTGNEPQSWINNNILNLDKKGRIITTSALNIREHKEIYAVGDCAFCEKRNGSSSGILAVKAVDTLAINLNNHQRDKKFKKWKPQRVGLQIVNIFNTSKPRAFAIYGNIIIGPSTLFYKLKNKIDKNFLSKLSPLNMDHLDTKSIQFNSDCRGCAAKIPQSILNISLRNSKLSKLADYPEDASVIFENDRESIMQSVDGFPALLSDPWLNARITTLHACSDLWACGLTLSSAQALITIPKVDQQEQKYLFTQSLQGIKSTIEELGGNFLGGHTFESRSLANKPYSLGMEISLVVQGILKGDEMSWNKYGMNPGDIICLSRPLGIGVFFAALMQNKNLPNRANLILDDLSRSQQDVVEKILKIQKSLGHVFVNASTDITGYGLFGHLKEMIDASNHFRKKDELKEIKVVLDLLSFQAYPGVYKLIKSGIRSSLFFENKKVFDNFRIQEKNDQSILFLQENEILAGKHNEKIELLVDPQTCGPLLISINKKYEKYLAKNWYKVGEVIAKTN